MGSFRLLVLQICEVRLAIAAADHVQVKTETIALGVGQRAQQPIAQPLA